MLQKLNNQVSIIQDLRNEALVSSTPLPKKIVKWWQWYNQLTGLDMVEATRRQVVILQDKLFECQDKRMISNRELTSATEKLNEIMIELAQTKHNDPKYIHLTKIEHEHASQQKRIFDQLTLSEKEEKDIFTQLATATKEYHDSQNLHSQKSKYFSFIVSALIGIVSLIGSMLLNNRKIVDVRITIERNQEKNESLFQTLTNQISNLFKMNQKQLSDLSKTMNNMISQSSQTIDKERRNENTSNVLVTSVKYSVNLLISGSSYAYRGICACGSYIVKPFYK